MPHSDWLISVDGVFRSRRHGPRQQLLELEASLTRLTADGADGLAHVAPGLRELRLSGSHFPTTALDGLAAEALSGAGGLEALTVNAAALDAPALTRLLDALGLMRAMDLAGTALGADAIRAVLERQVGLVELRLGVAPPRGYEHRFTPVYKGGDVLDAVGALTNLETLSLRGLEIGDEEVVGLANLADLARLDLGETRVTSATLIALAESRSLRELRIDGTLVDDEGVAALAGIKAITALALADSRVGPAGLAQLAGQRQLRRLNLAGLRVSDAHSNLFAGLTGLQELDLRRTRAQAGVLEALTEAPGLEALDLSDVGAEAVRACAALRGLRRLSLTSSAPAWSDLARLEALDQLAAPLSGAMQLPPALRRLEGGTLSSSAVSRLSEASRLEALRLTSGASHLAELPAGALPELRELMLGFGDLTDPALRRLLSAPAIEALYISDSPITPAGLEALVEAPFLHTLELRNIALDRATAQRLAALPRLHCLDIPGTGLAESDIALVAQAPNLQSLALDPGQITSYTTGALATTPISELYIYGAPLAPGVLAHLGVLPGLLELKVMDAVLNQEHVEIIARFPTLRVVHARFASQAAVDRLVALRPDLRGFAGAGEARAPRRRAQAADPQ